MSVASQHLRELVGLRHGRVRREDAGGFLGMVMDKILRLEHRLGQRGGGGPVVPDQAAAHAKHTAGTLRIFTVEIARGLMQIVLQNLLRNAWKFTGRCDSPRIEFGCKHPGNVTIFYVRDNGAGFDPRLADRLFKPFQRLHASSDFPGTGIGLATVRRIVRRHGGEVWAEGEVDKGATFYFTLEPAALNTLAVP